MPKSESSEESSAVNEGFLDARKIPKFQFELLDEELISCIKELYIKSKSHETKLTKQNQQLQERLSKQQYVDSLTQISSTLSLPEQLERMAKGSNKTRSKASNKQKILSDKVFGSSVELADKLSMFCECLMALNSKINSLDSNVKKTEERVNQKLREKTQTIEEQLQFFIKDYRNASKAMTEKLDNSVLKFQNQTKQIESNTLWKINQCNKRLDDRPNVQMVKDNIKELENRLSRNMAVGSIGKVAGDSDSNLEQMLVKLQKETDFRFVEVSSEIKAFQEKANNQFIDLKKYSEDRFDQTKSFENINVALGQLMTKTKENTLEMTGNKERIKIQQETLQKHSEDIEKLKKKVEKLTQGDEFAKLLQKIDPHEICRLGSRVDNMELTSKSISHQLQSLSRSLEAIRTKTEFWGLANSNPQKVQQSPEANTELISQLIKQELNGSDFKSRMLKFQHQLVDLSGLKEGVNEIIRKVSKVNKDSDLTNLKYEIKGVQEYIKKEILIVNNRITLLESSFNSRGDSKRRPVSGRGTDETGKLLSSVSTKKLLPVSCISCHQSNVMLGERKTVYSKYKQTL